MIGNVFVLWLLLVRFLTQAMAIVTYYLSKDCQASLTRDTLHPYSKTRHLRVDSLHDSLVIQSHDWWPHTKNHTVPGTVQIVVGTNQSQPTAYPLDFSCEIVIHTPVDKAKIMLHIDEFYIPSASEDCVENYLYVFDSNTAKFKAMPEAGGERGLCRASYPRYPIFTTKSYICLAFHTSAHPSSVPPNHRPGFRLILTAIHDTTSSTCPQDQFYCGSRPHPSSSNSKLQQPQTQQQQQTSSVAFSHHGRSFGSPAASAGSPSVSSAASSSSSAAVSLRTDSAGSPSHGSNSDLNGPVLGYCIPERTVCDGIVNCADERDESVNHCGDNSWRNRKSVSWIHRLLSLGVAASIAIAVSTIVTFTVCIGAVICCCNRCCGHRHPYQSRYPRIVAGSARMHALDASLAASAGYHQHHTSGSSSAVILGDPGSVTRTQFASWLGRGRHITGTDWNSHMTPFSQTTNYVPFCSYNSSQPGSVAQFLSTTARSGLQGSGADQKLAFRHPQVDFAMRSSMVKPGRDDVMVVTHASDSGPGQNCMVPHPSVGAPSSDSYSSIHANSSIQPVYPIYPRPPGPPPALMHGAMGSPIAYRRDTAGTDPCCYTPPPYGACTVPPASSVTASSSRTGTTSGGGGIGAHTASHSAWCPRGPVSRESGLMTTRGSIDGVVSASATDLCHVGSNGVLFGHQLSGGGNSVLHTNTPVETISQGGGVGSGAPGGVETPSGDLMSNGGILYLGELPQPMSAEDASMRFRGYPCGPGSTTTGSGSSHGPKLRSHAHRRVVLTDGPPGQPSDSHSAPSQNRTAADSSTSAGGRRSRAPSSRTHHHPHHHHHPQRRRYHHRSSDPNRATTTGASSGSHTPASSRSGMPANTSQRSGEAPDTPLHALPTAGQTVSFPVQL